MSITIIGGGISGITLALALSHMSNGKLKINLVEEKTFKKQYYSKPDIRTLVLSYGTYYELNSIDIWSTLVNDTTAITSIEIKGSNRIGKIYISASDYHLPALGYVIKLHKVKEQLFHLLQNAPGVILYNVSLKDIQRSMQDITVILSNGIILHSKLIIAADGTDSVLATQCGVKWKQKDYLQSAIVADINTTFPISNTAFEKFTSYGSLTLLPISKSYGSIIWCVPIVLKNSMVNWNQEIFCYNLQKELGWQHDYIVNISECQYYELKFRQAYRHISHRLVLVGNSAQTIHPIAAQGFNLSCRDIIILSKTLVHANMLGEDFGSYEVLLRYQRLRKNDQLNIINITEKLIKMSTSRSLPCIISKNLGLLAMSYIPFFRNKFINRTLGWISR